MINMQELQVLKQFDPGMLKSSNKNAEISEIYGLGEEIEVVAWGYIYKLYIDTDKELYWCCRQGSAMRDLTVFGPYKINKSEAKE